MQILDEMEWLLDEFLEWYDQWMKGHPWNVPDELLETVSFECPI